MAGSDADPRQVVESESFGAPVPGQWPFGAAEPRPDEDEGNRSGCLIVGGFWLGMFGLLWVPPLFALAWAAIGIALVTWPAKVTRRLNMGSTASTRSGLIRLLTAPTMSPLVLRGLGLVILVVVAGAVLAETA